MRSSEGSAIDFLVPAGESVRRTDWVFGATRRAAARRGRLVAHVQTRGGAPTRTPIRLGRRR